jgi:hypothetical protein
MRRLCVAAVVRAVLFNPNAVAFIDQWTAAPVENKR